jgi:error-prone DNA polymerase
VVWRNLAERQRQGAGWLPATGRDGKWEWVDGVEHLIASRLRDMTSLLGMLETK